MVWTCAEGSGHTGQSMSKTELPGRRKREKPQTRFMDILKEDMRVAVIEADARDMVRLSGRRKTDGIDGWI